MRTSLVFLAGLILLAACSSAPAGPDSIQDRKNRAADYLKFGRQAFQEAQYEQALNFYRFALDLDTAVDHEAGIAAAWNSVATAQTALGRLDEARAALLLAQAAAKESGDTTVMLQVAVNLVQADLEARDTTGARARLAAMMPFPKTAEGAALDHALGTLEKDEEHLPEALAAFDRALAVNQGLGLKQEMASNHFMKATVLGRQSQWALARTELQAALVLDKAMENTVGIAQDWRALGTVALKLAQPAEAFEAYVRASRVFQAAGLLEQQKRTVLLLLPLTETLGLTEETSRYRAILDRLSLP